jgi:hypothetical protein
MQLAGISVPLYFIYRVLDLIEIHDFPLDSNFKISNWLTTNEEYHPDDAARKILLIK